MNNCTCGHPSEQHMKHSRSDVGGCLALDCPCNQFVEFPESSRPKYGYDGGWRCASCGEAGLDRKDADAHVCADPVNNPAHYTDGGIECIDAIEAALTPEQFIGFLRGNAIKCLWRAGRKGDVVEDVEKSRWYTQREVSTHNQEGDRP